MSKAFIDPQGNYYEGDRGSIADTPVSQRPSPDYKYINNEWVLDQEKIDTESNNLIKKQLDEIDLKSIRAIREWLNEQETAPKYIKDYETQAKEIRSKLK